VIGSVALAVSWAASIVAVFSSTQCTDVVFCHSYSGWLFIPALGPTISLFDNLKSNGSRLPGEMEFYGVDTLVNVAALSAMIVGFAYKTNAPHAAHSGHSGALQGWAITPYVQAGATGVTLRGTFM